MHWPTRGTAGATSTNFVGFALNFEFLCSRFVPFPRNMNPLFKVELRIRLNFSLLPHTLLHFFLASLYCGVWGTAYMLDSLDDLLASCHLVSRYSDEMHVKIALSAIPKNRLLLSTQASAVIVSHKQCGYSFADVWCTYCFADV